MSHPDAIAARAQLLRVSDLLNIVAEDEERVKVETDRNARRRATYEAWRAEALDTLCRLGAGPLR